MVHPVELSNTATSVAAAAPAFNIRRLVLFAFIGPFIGVPFLLVFRQLCNWMLWRSSVTERSSPLLKLVP
jgi:hypothetical protein